MEGVSSWLLPPPNTAVTRSDTPFHCNAPGNENLSVTIVSITERPDAGSKFVRPNRMKNSGVAASAPATMPIT